MQFSETVTDPTNEAAVAAKAITANLETPKKDDLEAEAPAPKEEPKKELDSERFAAFARREKLIVKRDSELKSRESALAEREVALKNFESAKAEARLDPLKALEILGVSYDEITQFVLNDKKPTAEAKLQSLEDRLSAKERKEKEDSEARLEAEKKQLEERHAQTLQEYRDEVGSFIGENVEKYELIHEEGEDGVELVLAITEQHYQNTLKAGTPKILSKSEASDLAEKFFEDRARKLLATKKLGGLKADPNAPAKKVPDPAQPRPTLNNNLTPSATPSRPMSRDERIKRAMAVQIG